MFNKNELSYAMAVAVGAEVMDVKNSLRQIYEAKVKCTPMASLSEYHSLLSKAEKEGKRNREAALKMYSPNENLFAKPKKK